MRNNTLKEAVMRILPRVQTPAQCLGGELNAIAFAKDDPEDLVWQKNPSSPFTWVTASN